MVKLTAIRSDFAHAPYSVGDRIAQVFFERVEPVEFIEVDSLDDSQRGEGGFGSSGLK
jgi:dUTP pyrophosphatase